jgi:hypothetical protein
MAAQGYWFGWCIELLERHTLKELSEAEMLRVEKHVARCPNCRDHLEGWLGWVAAVQSAFIVRVRTLLDQSKKAENDGCAVAVRLVARMELPPS